MGTCLVIQHVAPEQAFAITDALERAGVRVETRRVFAGDQVPTSVSGFDGLVVMGGPMSAASDDGFGTRCDEMALLADAVRRSVPTLGICLGAQLLAAALGADVMPGATGPEIGWGSVTLLHASQSDRLFAGIEGEPIVLHWHGDTFDLPDGAVRLAANESYANQAFRVGDSACGIQFHLEVDASAVDGFLSAFGAEATAVVGGVDTIRRETPAAVAALASMRSLVAERFAALMSAG